ncbi:MAG TPA: SLC13 family permease [Gemmatimonadaceae bacterium]|nr:SLC13 family permease [Gemmatimonadaceae bacterium]
MATVRLLILLGTFVLIAVQQLPGVRLNRPAASLLGAVAMVTIGRLPLRDAYAAIDLNVMVFLLGVLLLTGYLELGGFFEWVAVRIVRRARSARILLALVIGVSGVLSAFFVNDTICLVLTPLVVVVVRALGFRPLPFLLGVALASNAGSAATPTGNPQNMLITVASGIHFARFVISLVLPAAGALAIVFVVLALVHRRDLAAAPLPHADAAAAPARPFDRALVTRALVVFGGALVGWLAGLPLPVVAITAAAVLVAVAQRDPTEAFATVEWPLLLFFGALFVVMRGVRDVPLVISLTTAAGAQLHGARVHDATIVSAAMVALSNLVSNVPAVLLWLPVVPKLADTTFVWLVMAMSSTFAGNLTLIGSLANIIVAERAQARGVRIGFADYLKVGIPVTLLTLAWGILVLALVTP